MNTHTIILPRQVWRSFRNWIGMKRLEVLEYTSFSPNYVFVLNTKNHYPHIHFICQLMPTYVVIDFHIDLSIHNSISDHEVLRQWHKTMQEFETIYPKLVELKRMNENAPI